MKDRYFLLIDNAPKTAVVVACTSSLEKAQNWQEFTKKFSSMDTHIVVFEGEVLDLFAAILLDNASKKA